MKESNPEAMPAFQSLDELIEFFETHDMGEYWDQLARAHFDVHTDALEELDSIQAYDEAKASGDEAISFEKATSEIENHRG